MRHPLALRIVTDHDCFDVTDLVGDSVTFDTIAPGGYGPLRADLAHTVWARELPHGARVLLDDTETGECLHDGLLALPGRSTQPVGQVWQLTSVGPSIYASYREAPYRPIDSSYDGWEEKLLSPPSSTAGGSTHPDDEDMDVLLFQFAEGNAIGPGNKGRAALEHRGFVDSGQLFGGLLYTHDAGVDDNDYRTQSIVTDSTGLLTSVMVRDIPFDRENADRTMSIEVAAPQGYNVPVLRIQYDGTVTGQHSPDRWSAVRDLTLRAEFRGRRNQVIRDGTWEGRDGENVDFNASPYVTADYIVIDMIRRFCPQYDIRRARVDETTFHIDQFAYPEPVRAADMLNDLILLEIGHTWLVWEKDDNTGLHRFEFNAWQDGNNDSANNPRYVFDDQAEIDIPGNDAEKCNRLSVLWRDRKGRARTTLASVTSYPLDDAGAERWAPSLNLRDEVALTATQARMIGRRLLNNHNNAAASGTVSTDKPVLDRYTDRWVKPHQLRAGETCVVSPLATGRTEDEPAMRITQTSFADSSGITQVTVGDPLPRDRDQVVQRMIHRWTHRERPMGRR